MDKSESPKKAGSRSRAGSRGSSSKSPRRATTKFLVVGIGASAGGVTALEDFFTNLPGKPSIAFVVVTHLSPEHESNLAPIIQKHTAMPVIQISETVPVRPGTVYVIPPAKQLSMDDGHIELSDLETSRSDRAPIDFFFRTLAETHTEWSAAIVLSGSGADGSVGLPRIKEMGGLTLAQDPDQAQYNQMPKNAIATGFVDEIMPVERMGQWLLNYNQNRHKIELTGPAPDEDTSGEGDGIDADNVLSRGDTLLEILALLRARTGHNFALYKRSTLNRRIERRMQVNDLHKLTDYLAFLGSHQAEVQALLRDLLISVTNFFRDREVWENLETNVIPVLFQGKDSVDSVVRVWVAGCATGEEAYSLAILLHEYASRLTMPPKLQIFATDLDENAIAVAREGSYPETIALDVSPDRLRQFFNHTGRRYRVHKEVRETILFAAHDLLKDPPFSRLDLVTCRNLLIYLNKDAQEQLLSLFHFSLKVEGFLLLGTSETADGLPQLFSGFDKKHHIYTRRTLPRFFQPVPVLPSAEHSEKSRPGEVIRRPVVPPAIVDKTVLPGELHQNMLEVYAPPSVVIDEKFDIVHLSDHAGRYMQFRGGEPSVNLIRVVHPDLRLDLRSGLYNAAQRGKANETRRIQVNLDGTERGVRLIIRPVKEPASLQGYILVIFDEIDETAEKEVLPASETISHGKPGSKNDEAEAFAHQLEEENEVLKSQLRTTVEQYETSLEELKASNEELQAINEELRSATEELETSREELQAVNEELLTVNQELKINVEEVSHVNSDLQNLMVSTDIATIFLNRQLRIKRYTPKVEQLFNIIPTDIDRPLAHLTHRLHYNGLVDDVEKVLRDLTPTQREVRTHDETWYLVRVLPYRTLEDRIEGVVLTFLDITERKHSEAALLESEERFRVLVNQATAGVCRVDLTSRLTFTNHKMAEILGFSDSELAGKSLFELTHSEDRADYRRLFDEMVANNQAFQIENRLTCKNGSTIWVSASVSPLRDSSGKTQSAVAVIIDISERKRIETDLRESEDRLQRALEIETVGVIFFRPEGPITSANQGFLRMSGYTEDDVKKGLVRWDIMTPPEWMPQSRHALEEFFSLGRTTPYEKEYIRKDGTRYWALFAATRVSDEEGVEYIIDITESKRAEQAVKESENRFRTLADLVPDLLWSNDPQGEIHWYNQRWLDYTGQTLEEAKGYGWLEVIHPDDHAQSLASFQHSINQGEPLNLEHRIRGKDGVYHWFLFQALPVRNEQGQITQWYGEATDIQEQRLAQADLEVRIRQRTAELEQLNNSLKDERARLAELSTRLMQVQESERRHLARELHDEIGQYLTGLKFMLDSIKLQEDQERARLLSNALSVVDDLAVRVRELSLNLRPSVLDDMGLLPALLWHIQRYTVQTGIEVDFRHRGLEPRLPSQLETTVYRLVQEALTNVARHAGVNKALVQVLVDDMVTIVIQDEGKGFNVAATLARHTSTGLSSMRERADLAGGTLNIESEPGQGTSLIAELPLPEPEEPHSPGREAPE